MTKSFKATFVNYGHSPSGEVMQLMFEVPLSEQYTILQALQKHRVQVEITPLAKLSENYSAQIIKKCCDLKFQLFMSSTEVAKKAEDCADAVRMWCGVATRVDIMPGTLAGARWEELLNMYHARLEGKWK